MAEEKIILPNEGYILTIVKPHYTCFTNSIMSSFKGIGDLKTGIIQTIPGRIEWAEHYIEHKGRIGKEGREYYSEMIKDYQDKLISLAVFHGNYKEFTDMKEELRKVHKFYYDFPHRKPVDTSDNYISANKQINIWQAYIRKVLLNNDFDVFLKNLQTKSL
ncbi:MAG: hypothetical protein AB7V77_02105 [Candidatus Woesearchaeota archaeon]